MKRCIVFAHFDRHNIVDDYVIFYLKSLRPHAQHIVFVSTAQLPNTEVQKVSAIVEKTLLRKNEGYDFMSWQKGLESVANLEEFDEVVIANDSVYGPVAPIEQMFVQAANLPVDFWGLTNNLEFSEHIQSYFVGFHQNVVRSEAFKDFWRGIQQQPKKRDVIQKYEVGLTQALRSAGYSYAVLSPHPRGWLRFVTSLRLIRDRLDREVRPKKWARIDRSSPSKPRARTLDDPPKKTFLRMCLQLFIFLPRYLMVKCNTTLIFWKKLIADHVPFIKIELLRDNPTGRDLSDWKEVVQKSGGGLPVEVIQKHIERMHS